MYYKHFMTAALVASIFTACNKDDNSLPKDLNGETKSVYLKFDTGRRTRAEEASVVGQKAELHSAIVYFLDKSANDGVILNSYVVDGTGNNLSIGELEEGMKFEEVSSAANYVYVVGNFNSSNENGEMITFPTKPGVTFSEIKNVAMEIEKVNYPSFGEDGVSDGLLTMLDGIAGITQYRSAENNWPSGANNQPQEDDHYAAVTIAPLNARIEVEKIEYHGEGLDKFTFEGIYINNFFSEMPVGLIPSSDNLVNYGSDKDLYNKETGYADYSTMWDEVNQVWQRSSANEIAKFFAGNDVFWGYHVFGKHNPVPHIVLKLTNVWDIEGDYLGERFVTVKGFTTDNSPLNEMEAGKVYTIPSLEFNDEHLGVVPEPDTVAVWVHVSVKEWEQVIVTPEL